jgi:hypothetical protein
MSMRKRKRKTKGAPKRTPRAGQIGDRSAAKAEAIERASRMREAQRVAILAEDREIRQELVFSQDIRRALGVLEREDPDYSTLSKDVSAVLGAMNAEKYGDLSKERSQEPDAEPAVIRCGNCNADLSHDTRVPLRDGSMSLCVPCYEKRDSDAETPDPQEREPGESDGESLAV